MIIEDTATKERETENAPFYENLAFGAFPFTLSRVGMSSNEAIYDVYDTPLATRLRIAQVQLNSPSSFCSVTRIFNLTRRTEYKKERHCVGRIMI